MMKFILVFMMLLIIKKLRMMWWESFMFLLLVMQMFMMEIPYLEKFHYIAGEWGVDFMGFSLIILSYWVSIIMISSSWLIKKDKNFSNYFLWLLLLLLLVLVICFMTMNMMYFYLFFEISLIPTFLIILGWGFQLERLQAGVYFMFYTLTASLPLLVNLLFIYSMKGSLDYSMGSGLGKFGGFLSFLLMLSLVMAFLIKLPVFFVHLWLPKAHVEAPVAGSMILAGVLLKLGGFGLSRVVLFMKVEMVKYSGYMIGLGMMSMIYVGLVCCRLNDLKALVAYSSVSHMGLVFAGLVTLYSWGMSGGLVMMISHGLSSSGLFCMVNLYYERLGSRSMYMNKGLLLFFPLLSLMLFLLCAANISAPPSINLMGEIFLMISILKFNKIMMVFFPLGSFLGAVFTLFMFSYSQHGKNYYLGMNFMGVSLNEIHMLVLHVIPINLIIMKPDMFFY